MKLPDWSYRWWQAIARHRFGHQLRVFLISFVKTTFAVLAACWITLRTLTAVPLFKTARLIIKNKLVSSVIASGLMVIGALLVSIQEEPLPQPDPEPENRPLYEIGTILSLTGDFERRGSDMRRGYEIALTAYNNSGGIRINGVPHNLALVIYDDESSPVRAAEVSQLMFLHEQPQVLLAPYSSALANPAVRVAQEYKVPVVVPIASTAGFARNLTGVFLLQTPPDRHLIDAARLFRERVRNIRASLTPQDQHFVNGENPRVLLAAGSDAHSQAVLDSVRAELAAINGLDLSNFDLSLPAEEFATVQEQLTKSDAMFTSAFAPGANRLVETIATEGINIPFLALTHCEVAHISRREPTAAEGALCARHWQQEAKFNGTPPLADTQFSTSYYDTYGSRPTHHAAAAAAAVQIIVQALRNSESQNISLLQALQNTDYNTFYGPIRFDAQGQNTAKPMVLSQINRSRYIPIAPANIAVQQVNYIRPQLASADK